MIKIHCINITKLIALLISDKLCLVIWVLFTEWLDLPAAIFAITGTGRWRPPCLSRSGILPATAGYSWGTLSSTTGRSCWGN